MNPTRRRPPRRPDLIDTLLPARQQRSQAAARWLARLLGEGEAASSAVAAPQPQKKRDR